MGENSLQRICPGNQDRRRLFQDNCYSVAQAALLEYVGGMDVDIFMYRDLDGIYIEVWKRVDRQAQDEFQGCFG